MVFGGFLWFLKVLCGFWMFFVVFEGFVWFLEVIKYFPGLPKSMALGGQNDSMMFKFKGSYFIPKRRNVMICCCLRCFCLVLKFASRAMNNAFCKIPKNKDGFVRVI